MEGSKLAAAILGEVRRAVVGKDEVLAKVLLAILAGGHILLEDIPGVGKTTMALAFSKALSLRYNRVQFTPDVMPSDITGFTLYNKEAGRMEYQPGAVLCNLFLADELNRATSRTQSALLEAMEEGQVTVDGVSHPVPQPFLVIATQNPAGASGTQLLPDSQMDRFMVRLSIGYPAPADEMAMVRRRQGGALLEGVRPVLELNGPLGLRAQAGPGELCFVEEPPLLPWLDRLEGLVLYRWNRRYPADAWLDVRPGPPGWTLARREEFSGHSHERITKEVYTR